MGTWPLAVAVDDQTNKVFVVNLNGSVSVLDARAGTLRRSIALGPQPVALAVDQRSGHVFVAGQEYLYVLDAATGTILRRTPPVPVAPLSAMMAVDQAASHLFAVQTYRNRVSMLDSSTGAVLRTVRVGRTPWSIAIDAGGSHAFVGNVSSPGGESVSILDTRTGAVVHTVAVGNWPGAIAVDEQTRHVFAANRDSNTVTMLAAGPLRTSTSP